MSVIFIPSKKIYDVNHKKISNNAITKIEQSFYGITKEFGNVLTTEYNLRFFEDDPRVDINPAFTLYTTPENNYGFVFEQVTENGITRLNSTLALPFNKLTGFIFGTNDSGETPLTSHKLKSTRRISTEYGTAFIEKTELLMPIVTKIDRLAKVIYLKYSVVLQENNEITYSDTISLVGDYIVPEEQTQTIGDGNKSMHLPSNEIIQEGNTNLEKFANDILANYGKGKETITVRCSIGEYYDEYGDLVISTKTADKMTFEHYDRVVFMTRNGWGTDSPISLNANGNAKVFEVVGVRVLADGAVWQELKAREVGEVAVEVQLPSPIVRIVGDTLQITDISGKAEEFDVYVNGGLVATITDTEYDLSALSLPYGSHTVWAVARASGYKQSAKSQSLWYILKEQFSTTYYTEVNSANGLTYFITSNDYTVVNGTYKIGEQG